SHTRGAGRAGAAGRSGRDPDGFARSELCLDPRLLALDRDDLCVGPRQLDRSPETDRCLCGRPLAPPRQPVGLGRRLLALAAENFSTSLASGRKALETLAWYPARSHGA